MSKAREGVKEESVGREELLEFLRKEIERLERRIAIYKALVQMLEGGEESPLERGEEIKVGRRRLGKLIMGENYVRLIVETQQLPQLIREYLEGLEKDLRELQTRSGTSEGEELARITVKERPGEVEIRVDNIYTTIELIKARAGLKYAAEALYELVKSKEE